MKILGQMFADWTEFFSTKALALMSVRFRRQPNALQMFNLKCYVFLFDNDVSIGYIEIHGIMLFIPSKNISNTFMSLQSKLL